MADKTICFFLKKNHPPFVRYCNVFFRRSISIFFNPKEVKITQPEKETHTGQKWEENDYRLARFQDKTKLVNPNWAVKLIADVPPIPIKGRVTYCDGGVGPLGHPKVYINLDKPGNHACLYCGLRFYKDSNHC